MDDLAQHLSGDDQNIEILCNRFAAEFLIPSNDINKRLINMQPEDENLSNIAYEYRVSKEVILRRMLNLDVVNNNFYERWRQEQQEHERQRKKEKSKGGGNYYFTKKSYLSETYAIKVFEQYYQGKITRDQAANYLGVKTGNIDRLEAVILTGSNTL